MVSCHYCTTTNSLDSAFCKKCGKLLPSEEVQDARQKLEERVSEGYALFDQGRTDEAAMIAETTLASDPGMARALSLRAMVLERRGLYAEALDAYEAVLARHPNSALDQIKANQLRNMLANRGQRGDRRPALIAAGGAALLVMVIGAFGAIATSKPRTTKDTVAMSSTQQPASYSMTPFEPAPRESAPRADVAANSASTSAPAATQTQPAAQNPVQALSTNVPANTRLPQPGLGGVLPDAAADNKPVNPLPTGFEIRPMGSSGAPSKSVDPEPAAREDGRPQAVQTPPAEDQGYIDIRVSEPEQPKASSSAMNRNGIEALVRTARSQYQVGNYQAAAATYERALAAGADPATTNQRLAQCYEKLGRQSDAVEAYNRAIAAMEGRLNAGKADDRLRAALDSSRQALQNLQGG